MLYRILPTDTRSMPLRCEPEEFAQEYHACRQNPDRPTDNLYRLVTPFFEHWDQMLRDHNQPKDINYAALCQRLVPTGETPFELLNHYVNWADQVSSVREELELLFFERLRHIRYYPTAANPRMVEYVVAMDFRNYLKNRIQYSGRHPIDIPSPELTFSSLEVEDVHPDHLLLKNLGLDAWESYLLTLMKKGLSALEIAELTRLPRKTFAQEESEIWHKLKTKWHQA